MKKTLMGLGVCALTLAACSEPVPQDYAEDITQSADTQNTQADWPPQVETDAEISASDFRYRISTLADDRFEGRAPASLGGEAAAQWIADEMARMGAQPAGEDGSYFQQVPLIEATLDVEASSYDITIDGVPMGLANGQDVVYWSKIPQENVAIENTDLVFVGYGVVAPEYGWNDYAGVDVEGKTVVMLVNDPGFANPDGELFNGRSMTYYGRWTYKYEEAARQGAAGVIVIHQTEPASYPWEVVNGSWSGAQFTLQREGDLTLAEVESWIHIDAARRLFEATGLDFDALEAAAAEPGFQAVEMEGAQLSASLSTDLNRLSSNNVAGIIEGSERPDEYVLYMAHWDHLGQRLNFSAEDQTYNGAVDNATGTSAILEVGEAFARGEQPERSVIMVAVTAEESGLLGSAWYAENPLVPLSQTVGGINIDAMLPIGPTNDVIVVGYGASELEDVLRAEAESRGRYLVPDPRPEAGSFYRSDHASLARVGVPMLYADGGLEHVELGREHGEAIASAYQADAYHKPADEYSEDWDMSGFVSDTQLLYAVGAQLANSEDWPNWYEGNEFRALRDAMRSDAQ